MAPDAEVRRRTADEGGKTTSAVRWGAYSLLLAAGLAAVDAAVAYLSGSIAVRAETIHNTVDLIAAASVLAGIKLSARRSASFPYGLYKVENLVALALGVLTFVSAWEIARSAVAGSPISESVDPWMLASIGLTAAVPFVFSYLELSAGRRLNSPALVAAAREYRLHILTASAVFAALAVRGARIPFDRGVALFIAAVIVWTGWQIVWGSLRVLLDASMEPKLLERIKTAILGEKEVAELLWITGRNAGRHRFVEAAVALRLGELGSSEAVIRRVEAAVHRVDPYVARVVIDARPLRRDGLRFAAPLADMAGTLSDRFGAAPFFCLSPPGRVVEGAVRWETIENPYVGRERSKGLSVARWLIDRGVGAVVTREDLHGKAASYVLNAAGVEMRTTNATTVSELASALAITEVPAAPHRPEARGDVAGGRGGIAEP